MPISFLQAPAPMPFIVLRVMAENAVLDYGCSVLDVAERCARLSHWCRRNTQGHGIHSLQWECLADALEGYARGIQLAAPQPQGQETDHEDARVPTA